MVEDVDCTSCRLISGGGLCAAGAYVGYHGSRIKGGGGEKKFVSVQLQRGFMAITALSLLSLGVARLLSLPPFSSKTKEVQEITRSKR